MSGTVLLVAPDDDNSLEAMLQALGWTVLLSSPDIGPEHHVDVVVMDDRVVDGIDISEAFAVRGVPSVVLVESITEAALAATAPALPDAFLQRPVDQDDLAGALLLARHRAQQRAAVVASERWFRTALRSIADAVITADENARVTFVNPTAEALTGWSESDAIGRALDEIFRIEENDNDALKAGSHEDGSTPSVRMLTRTGSVRVVEHNAAPIVDRSGGLFGIVVVFRDVTERRRLEQRLALADRMTSLGTLAAGVAHELNNPLAFVTSNLGFARSEIARLKGALPKEHATGFDEVADALREASEGAVRATDIIKDMKVFSRGTEEEATLVDVNRVVAFASRLVSNDIKHRAELVTTLSAREPVRADEGKLVQVLVNLLTNAAQSMDDTSITRRIEVLTASGNDAVTLVVKDSGRGIAPEHLARVFEPFFTTKAVGQGLGLGLSIAHSIISQLGGTISIESNAPGGTTVTVSLPIAERNDRPSEPPAPAPAPLMPARVLVIDDEPLICTAIRRILARHHVDVVVEEDGKSALARLAAGERYDAVLCDMMMPGFSGVDLYEALDQAAPDMKTRVVFMTGNAFTPRAHELFTTTTNVRIEKPFVPADLTRAIVEVMRRHGSASPFPA